MSSTPPRSSGTSVATRRLLWCAATCGGQASAVRTCPTCQRGRQPAACRPAEPAAGPPAGGCISLYFPERSGHDFLQVHIDLLTWRLWQHWPVPTLKTCTTETVESNFVMVASMFLDVGLPVVLILDSDTRFTSAFWTGASPAPSGLHQRLLDASLGASLNFS